MATSMKAQLSPISAEWLSKELQQNEGQTCCLVDIRPSAQHCCSHIRSSENINFSNILLRRLMKGVVTLDTHISSKKLVERITQRNSTSQKLVLYDSGSSLTSVRMELTKHAEVLYKTENCVQEDPNSCQVHYLNGGFTVFSEQYPDLCEKSSSAKKAHNPIGISVSASLPISLTSTIAKQRYRAQTPLEDESSRFGPPVEVLPYLVLGCERDSSNLVLLRKLGITAVLNVSHNCANHFEELFEYKTIPVQDSHHADLLSKLDTAFDFISYVNNKGGRVFVHCHAGISRSATVCIAYIMKHMLMDLTKAYDFVKQKRPCISPNLHFMGQLLEFQKRLAATDDSCCYTISDGEVAMEIDSIPVTTPTTSSPTTAHSSEVLPPVNAGIRDLSALRLPLNFKSNSASPKRKLKSASAPNSIDIPEGTQVNTKRTETSSTGVSSSSLASKLTGSVEVSYNHKPMRPFYSSTDGALYCTMLTDSRFHQQQELALNFSASLPSTPVDSPSMNRLHPLPTTCRYQNQHYQDSGFIQTNSLENSIQLSPCRVVPFHGNKFV